MRHFCSRAAAWIAALALASACGKPAAVINAAAVIDTLPHGIIRVTSNEPTGWRDSSAAWKIREVRRFGTPNGPGELIDPGSLGIDGAGRLYVVDSKPAVIKVFDSAGTFIRTIGREGAGPGEFRVAFMAVRGGHVVVHDPQQSRTSVFDTTGAFVASWKSSCCYWDEVAIDQAERIYIPTMGPPDSGGRSRGRAFTRFTLTGALIDTLYVPDRSSQVKTWEFSQKGKDGKSMSRMSSSVPYTPVAVQTYHPEGGFVTGWSAEYSLVRSPGGSDTTRVMRRAWTPEVIPTALRQARVDEMVKNATNMVGESNARATVRLDDVPTKAPAFTSLKVDGAGYLWARRLIGGDSIRTTFDVFAPAGAWLGGLTMPVAVPEYGGHVITAGDFYTRSEDDDGRPVVIRFRIIR